MLLGLGIDVIEAARIRRLLERLPRAYERLFSPQERAYCDDFVDPWPHYAARFAAKEAVGKALGIGIIGFVWRDVEVLSGGKPLVALHGGVAEVARGLGVTHLELSLSHTGGRAYAVAAALGAGAAALAAGAGPKAAGAEAEAAGGEAGPRAADAEEAPHV